MKSQYIKSGVAYFALNFKAATSSIARAIVSAHYAEIEDNLNNNTSYPKGRSIDNSRWHSQLPKTEDPDATVVLIVRDPVERFRSACVETGKTPDEALSEQGQKNSHFWPTSRLLVSGCKLYRFETDLDAAATELGLTLPLPNIDGGNGEKPTLTVGELARVQAIYADDIALFDSITNAGQVWVTPPTPATDEIKAAKIQEFSNFAKVECEADITVDGIGILHVDSDTLHDLKTIEELVTDGTSPILVAGKYPSYKCVDGSMVDIGTTEITAIKTAMITRKYTAYSVKLKGLVDTITAATTVEELDAITW